MNKRHYLVAAMCLMTLAACTQKTELPENPKIKKNTEIVREIAGFTMPC